MDLNRKMRIYKLLITFTLSMLLFSCSKKEAETASDATKAPVTAEDKYSYVLGYDVGNSYLKTLTADSVKINMDYVHQGIVDGMKDLGDSSTLLLTKMERELAMNELQTMMQAKQEAKMQERAKKYEERSKTAVEDSKKFLAENKAKPGVTTEKSGLQYKVIKEGNGETPKLTDIIKFHMIGKFIDGEEFQSTREMEAPEVKLNEINIKGIQEAVQKMKVGSTWEIVLPANLAYGDADTGVIPPNSAVVFEIELLDIIKEVPVQEGK